MNLIFITAYAAGQDVGLPVVESGETRRVFRSSDWLVGVDHHVHLEQGNLEAVLVTVAADKSWRSPPVIALPSLQQRQRLSPH